MKKINKIILAMVASQGVVFAGLSAEDKEDKVVEISPVVSNGWDGGFKNAPSNFWLTVDQSMSMQATGGRGYLFKEGYKVKKPTRNFGNQKNATTESKNAIKENIENLISFADGGLIQGYVAYNPDPNVVYEIPKDYLGRDMPLPKNVDETYSLTYEKPLIVTIPKRFFDANGKLKSFDWIKKNMTEDEKKAFQLDKSDEKKVIPKDIFMSYAEQYLGVEMCYSRDWDKDKGKWSNCVDADPQNKEKTRGTGQTLDPETHPIVHDTVKIVDAYKSSSGKERENFGFLFNINKSGWKNIHIPWLASGSYPEGIMKSEDSCAKATDKRKCQIWKTYYSTRILALKSAVSLAIYYELGEGDNKDKKVRFGFQPLYDANKNAHQFALNVPAIQRLPLKVNSVASRKELYRWLFSLTPDFRGKIGTTTRRSIQNLLQEVRVNARTADKYKGKDYYARIFLEDPSQKYDAKTNKKYTCRKSSNIIFTDGGWGSVSNKEARLGGLHYDSSSKVTELPDGTPYNEKMKPYYAGSGIENIADMALSAWITDLDANTSNNKPDDEGAVIVPDLDELEAYKDKDGTEKIYKNPNAPAGKQEFWHPFYDLATWQHINTHTIGFQLYEPESKVNSNGKQGYKNIHINPPYSIEAANELDTQFGLNKFMSGAAQWQKATSGKEIGYEYAIADMARAALAGRGLFFNAKSGEDAIEAFRKIIAESSKPPQEKAATTGASGSSASSGNIGNVYLTTRYDGDSFTGDLLKKDIYNGEKGDECFSDYDTGEDANTHEKRLNHRHLLGEFCDKSGWSAADRLKDVAPDSRKIFTLKIKSSNKKLIDKPLEDDSVTNNTLSYEVIDFADDAFKISETIAGNETVSLYQRAQLLNGISQNKEARRIFKHISPKDENDDTSVLGILANNKKLSALFTYIRGDDTNEQKFDDCKYNGQGIFRSRSQYHYNYSKPLSGDECGTDRNILGALVRSSAMFSGKPNLALAYLDTDGSAYQNYKRDVIEKYNDKTKKEVIYIGSNDGMLHAFDPKTGDELFAYVPTSIYNRLAQMVVPKRQLSLVDGKITIEWINLGGDETNNDNNDDWKQYLLAGFGGGGKGIYSLDITSTDGIDGAWEYGELQSQLYNKEKGNKQGKSNIGNIMWKPAIIQLKDNTWVAITGNGYNSETGKAVLIMLDVKTGKPIQELELPENLDDRPNGLSQLYFASYPDLNANTPEKIKEAMKKINIIDRAYAGDLQGNLWVFDFTEATKAGGVKVDKNKPLFTAKVNVAGEDVRQPITATPLVMQHPTKKGHLVHFGTGSLFAVHDLSSKVPNSLYGIWDDWIPKENGGLDTPRDTTVEGSELNVIKMKETEGTFAGNKVQVRYLEGEKETDWAGNHRGWKINLTFDAKGSERAWQSPKMTYGKPPQEVLNYRTVRYIDDKDKSQCGGGSAGVEGWDMVFNPADASKRLNSPAIDANGDGVIDDKDMVKVSDGNGGTTLIPIPPTGIKTEGSFKTNSTNNNLQREEERACQLIVSSSIDSNSQVQKTAIPVCSYVSSWKELRQEKKKK